MKPLLIFLSLLLTACGSAPGNTPANPTQAAQIVPGMHSYMVSAMALSDPSTPMDTAGPSLTLYADFDASPANSYSFWAPNGSDKSMSFQAVSLGVVTLVGKSDTARAALIQITKDGATVASITMAGNVTVVTGVL